MSCENVTPLCRIIKCERSRGQIENVQNQNRSPEVPRVLALHVCMCKSSLSPRPWLFSVCEPLGVYLSKLKVLARKIYLCQWKTAENFFLQHHWLLYLLQFSSGNSDFSSLQRATCRSQSPPSPFESFCLRDFSFLLCWCNLFVLEMLKCSTAEVHTKIGSKCKRTSWGRRTMPNDIGLTEKAMFSLFHRAQRHGSSQQSCQKINIKRK